MKANKWLSKIDYVRTGSGSLSCRCYGTFINEISRCALLAIVLGIAVVLATGCSSTSGAIGAGRITAIRVNKQATDANTNNIYEVARSPGFNELAGG